MMQLPISRKWIMVTLLIGSCVLTWSSSDAAIEAVTFEDPAMEQRYQGLIAELRCLVCQNQNLADSDADLAKDLRRKTAEMLKQGKSDQEILDYMSERFGDFVLYRPPFSVVTALLWLGPFVLLGLSVTWILLAVRRRQADNNSSDTLDEEQRQKIKQLLENKAEFENQLERGE